MSDIWDSFNDIKDSLVLTDEDVKTEKTNVCVNCKENNIIKDEGRYMCKNCGADNGQQIQETAEWRYYEGDSKRKKNPMRCGYVLDDDSPFNGAGGLVILGYGKEYFRRVHKWNQLDYKEVILMNDYMEIKKYCYLNNLPGFIIDDAKTYYKLIKKTCSKIGRSPCKLANMAVCVYFSCKLNNINRELKDMANLFGVESNKMSEAINDFHKCFHYLESCGEEIPKYQWLPTTSQDYIRLYSTTFNLDKDIIELCVYVANMIDILGLITDNIPHSVGISCIYFVCNILNIKYVTKKQLAEKCGISEVTISKSCKRLEPYLQYLFPKELLLILNSNDVEEQTT